MQLDFLPLVLTFGAKLCSAWWNNPERPHTRLGWARRGAPPSAPLAGSKDEAGLAREILRNLPPGANAYYEAPDGTRLLVWRSASLPGTHGEGDGYQLW